MTDESTGLEAYCKFCGVEVELSPDAMARWKSFNEILRAQREAILSPLEVACCGACKPAWDTERENEGHA